MKARFTAFAAPTLFGALVATIGGGAWGACSDHAGLLYGGASIGFVSLLTIPLGLALSGVGRLLWRAWRPHEIASAMRDPVTGGLPRVAAWGLYLIAAVLVLAVGVLQGMNVIVAASASYVVHVLAAPILAVIGALALVALSRPLALVLGRALVAFDARVHARRGRSWFTPRLLGAGAALIAALLLSGAWFVVVRPQIGHLDLSFLPATAFWFFLLMAAPFAWSSLSSRPRFRRAALAVCAVAVTAAIGGALWLRAQRPYAMLEIWGDSRLSGFAIDWLFDIEGLRGDLDLDSFRPAARPAAQHHDVVLVTIDTVRADRTPPYGGAAAMPALTRLAREGALFQWAFSPGNVTRRSLPAIAMGVASPRLRGRVTGWALKLDPRHILLAERMRAAGYETAGFFCCTSQFGEQHRLGLIRGLEHVEIEKDGEELARLAARWLHERKARPNNRPLFVWMHLIEPHGWQKSHPAMGDTRRRKQRYDLSLADADRALELLLREVWDDASKLRTFVVVTSDHGEALGDHGYKTHADSLYNSEIHVPLVIAGPGIPAGRIARPASLSDLAPTLIDLAGFQPPGMPEMDGTSLAAVARGEASNTIERGTAYAAMIADRSVAISARALIEGRYKLIVQAGKVELYDYIADPGELRDIAEKEPAVTARLKEKLAARREVDKADPFR